MALPEGDVAVAHSFGIEVDGVVIKQIQQVDGLRMDQDEIELRENTPEGKFVLRKLPGRPKPAQITLTRGLTDSNSFNDWIKQARLGKVGDARKGGAIIVYDYEGEAIRRYKLTDAWPTSLSVGPMRAGDTSIITETLVLTCSLVEPE